MEDRRNVAKNSCNFGEGTDQTGPVLDVYDDDADDGDDDIKKAVKCYKWSIALYG